MSGQHRNPRRKLSQDQAQWEAQDQAAAQAGLTWSDWARARLVCEESGIPEHPSSVSE